MQSAVEETPALIALHNIWEEKLLKSLRLGGFPMPSIAVVRADQGHKNFGDISVVFSKDTIDPERSSANKVYSGDAWTPTYPQVDIKLGEKASKIYSRAMKEAGDLFNTVDFYPENVLSKLKDNDGDARKAFKDSPVMQYMYLTDKGITVDMPVKQMDFDHHGIFSNQDVQAVIEQLKDSAIIERLKQGYADSIWIEENTDALREAANEAFLTLLPEVDRAKFKNSPIYTEKNFDFDTANWLHGAIVKALKNPEATTPDVRKLEETLPSQIKDKEDYGEWIDKLFSGVIEKTGIRNKKDMFTPSGNRRSFESLHYEETLENVVKAMKEQGEQGLGLFGGSIIGAAPYKYVSIGDIKEDAGRRLRKMSDEEMLELRKEFNSRFSDLAHELVIHKDSGSAPNDAKSMMIEAIQKYKTREGIANYIKREGKDWTRYSEEIVDDLIELVTDIRNMPSTYFEAKPQRAVGFDEVRGVVIPDNASDKLKTQLADAGLNVLEYEPGNNADRLEKVNSIEDVKFSPNKAVGETAASRQLDEMVEQIKAKKRTNAKDREILRDAGEKLSEKDFYSLYSVHKLDLRKNGNIAEQVSSIKENGFRGDAGFGHNVVPSSINNMSRYTVEERRERLREVGLSEETIDESIANLKENPGNGVWSDDTYFPEINYTQRQYGGRKGDTVLFVPEHFVDNGEKVINGFKPFDYEVVEVEYDYQPYYELYSKAYDNRREKLKYSDETEALSDILNMAQHREFMSRIDNDKKSIYTRAQNGDYIIPIDNMLVYTDYRKSDPGISSIIVFNTDNHTDIDGATNLLLQDEKGGIDYEQTRRTIEGYYGEGYIQRYNNQDWGTSARYDRQYERGKRRSDAYHAERKSRRANFHFEADEPGGTELKHSTPGTANIIEHARIQKENAELRKLVEELENEFKTNKGYKASIPASRKAAKTLIDNYFVDTVEAELTPTALAEELADMANKIARDPVGSYDDVRTRAEKLAYTFVWNSKELVDAGMLIGDAKQFLRSQKIYVDPKTRADIADFNAVRKEYFGRLNMTFDKGNGRAIDDLYQELSTQYSWLFPDDIVNPSDQLEQIFSVTDSLPFMETNPYSEYDADTIDMVANDIISTALELQGVKNPDTYADRANKRLEKTRQQRDEKIAQISQHYKDQKQRAKDRKINSETWKELQKIGKRMERLKTTGHNRAVIEEVLGNYNTISRRVTGSTLEKLADLRRWVNNQLDTNSEYIIDSETRKKLDRLEDIEAQIIEAGMTLEEVIATGKGWDQFSSVDMMISLIDTLKAIETQIRNENKTIDTEDRRDIYMQGVASNEAITDSYGTHTAFAKFMDKYLFSEVARPSTEMLRLVGYNENAPLYQRFLDVTQGQRDMVDYARRANEKYFDKFIKDKDFIKQVSGKKAREIEITGEDENRRPVTLKVTPDLLMSMYMHSLNDQNTRHIKEGGMKVPDVRQTLRCTRSM